MVRAYLEAAGLYRGMVERQLDMRQLWGLRPMVLLETQLLATLAQVGIDQSLQRLWRGRRWATDKLRVVVSVEWLLWCAWLVLA